MCGIRRAGEHRWYCRSLACTAVPLLAIVLVAPGDSIAGRCFLLLVHAACLAWYHLVWRVVPALGGAVHDTLLGVEARWLLRQHAWNKAVIQCTRYFS